MNAIRQPFLYSPSITLKSPLCSAGLSSLHMSQIQASALKSAYSYEYNNDSDSDDLEDLVLEPKPLMKRRVRLDYVSDYEWDEDNDYLEDYEFEDDDDDVCSVDSDITLPVSNKEYVHQGKLSPVSSSTNSTTTMRSDCSVSSAVSFDSAVAVSRHHQPTAIYHHRRSFSPSAALPLRPSTKKETRHSFPAMPSIAKSNTNTPSSAKKPFVRADLMPTPLSNQDLLVSPPSPRRKRSGPISRRLFRTSSSRSTGSVKTI